MEYYFENVIQLLPGDQGYLCLECSYKTTAKQCMKRHVESRHLRLKLPCTLCPTVLNTNRSRQVHYRTVHNISMSVRDIIALTESVKDKKHSAEEAKSFISEFMNAN